MRNILTLFVILLCLNLQAQEPVSSTHIGWKGGDIQIHTISNKTNSCSFIIKPDSIKAILLDNNAKIIGMYSAKRHTGDEKYSGGYISSGIIHLYMWDSEWERMRAYEFNIAGNSVTEGLISCNLKKNRRLGHVSSDNHFCFLAINKKPEFVIYDFKDGFHFDTTRIPVAESTWDLIRTDLVTFSPFFDVGVVDMDGEWNIETAKSPSKIYVHNDTLFLLNNKEKQFTNVYAFDLNTRSMSARRISHQQQDANEVPEVENSFLLNDKLYYAAAASKRLIVQVIDFSSGKLLKEFHANADEEISFKNGEIVQEGGVYGGSRELEKTKQLIRKMIAGKAVIIANTDSAGQIEISVGSYLEGGGGGGLIMGSMAGGTTPMFVPTGYGSWKKSARFDMLLDANTNEHIPGKLAPDINDKIEEFSNGKKIPKDGEDLFLRNGRYYYAWYDKKERTFNIVKF